MLTPAKNGREGLHRIEQEKPDIILSDIRMPDLNGLEMLSFIPLQTKAPYVIVVTGYSDFEYARRSIQLGVKEFLLKPFTSDNLIQIVEDAIASQRSSFLLSQMMRGTFSNEIEEGLHFLFKYNRLLDEKEIYLLLRKYMLRFLNPGNKLEEYSDPESGTISFFLHHCTEIKDSNLNELTHLLSQNYMGKIIGSWSTSPQHNKRIKTLHRSLDLHRYYSLDIINHADVIYQNNNPIAAYPWQQEKNLLNDLRNGRIENAQKIFTEWFTAITDEFHQAEELNEQIEKMIHTLMNILKEISYRGFKKSIVDNLTGQIKGSLTQTDTISCFQKLISYFRDEVYIPESENQKIQKVLLYIHSRLKEPITLEDTAEYFRISPEHLSRQFKEEVNMGFNIYVNKKKIEIAKEMISKGKTPIQDIANALGYSSSRYFSRVFKKNTTLSPREYRELH